MEKSETSDLTRLAALAEEAEQILARSFGSHDIRHACALARGYLDLALFHQEPVNVADVERVLARMRGALSDSLRPKLPARRKSSRSRA